MMRFGSRALAAMAVMGVVAGIADVAEARIMFHFDLESLVWMSTDVVEGEVVAAKEVNYVNVLTIKVENVYAGEKKVGEEVVVGLSAYRKQKKDKIGNFADEKIGVGEKGIWSVEPAREEWKKDGIPYWPAGSGVKLIVDGKVTGMVEGDNPGPYVNSVDEGEVKAYREKVEKAVKDVTALKKEFAEKKDDAAWLLEKLKDRPAVAVKDETGRARDAIGVALCEAIRATKDPAAIKKAKEMGRSWYERQLLGG